MGVPGNRAGADARYYTVLVEGDDMSEPVAGETRSILDGRHRAVAPAGRASHYPAIDVLHSVSRVMNRSSTAIQRHTTDACANGWQYEKSSCC